MYRSYLFFTAALIGTAIALVQPMALAKSSLEVGRIAKAITVEIKQVGSDKVGSGILLQKQGAVYTVLTAGHVVNSGAFTLRTSDGQVHQVISGSVRSSGNNIDLAVLKFRSNNNYSLAKIGTSKLLEPSFTIYVAGFPKPTRTIEAGTFNFTKGEVIGIATKANENGYSLIYSNITFKGMSGGAVLNEAGELVAIHGQGDRDDAEDGRAGAGEKTGRNLGIVVERFGTVASSMGLRLEQKVAILPQNQALNASDYFLRGKGKYFKLNDIEGALADYNQAIALNPKFPDAYNGRGVLKANKLYDIRGALADYNQAISISPKFFEAHYNRALLKENKLNDVQEALADYNQAISINPKFFEAYVNRGLLRYKLNDVQEALADYNQAISINPKIPEAYHNRGTLRYVKLSDQEGAIQDFRQAARLYREQRKTEALKGVIKNLRLLGATE